jgi:hypothetical protein
MHGCRPAPRAFVAVAVAVAVADNDQVNDHTAPST